MLTIKQKKLLDYIKSYYNKKELFPTFDEMKDNLKIKSKSGIYKLLSSLEEKGFIKKTPHKARALKLTNVKNNIINNDETELPFLGRIAAGNPIEAVTGSFEQISVPNYLVNNSTLIEEHIAGIPGDQFIKDFLPQCTDSEKAQIAKEYVKFNERSMIRLLGDMRAYNYVVVPTHDFDQVVYKIRPIDFDQQSFEGKLSVYRPQFFKENKAIGIDAKKPH